MRTKTLFLAAAITAAGLASSMAQSNVYSLNVVGYVNVVLTAGSYNMIANPLNNTSPNGNSLSNLFQAPVAGNFDQVLTWKAADNDFDYVTQPIYGGGVWDKNVDLPPGKGFFYVSASLTDKTNTFVGEVVQGSFTNPIIAGSYNLIGSSAPIGGNHTNAIDGLAAVNFDQILGWKAVDNDFDYVTQPIFGGGVWDKQLNVPVGAGFFYVSAALADRNWVRTFNVPTP